MDVLEQVKGIVVELLDVDPGKVTPDATFKEDLEAERLEGLKCPICKEVKPKMFDICKGEDNVTACAVCVRQRHERKGLSGQ